MFIDGIDLKCTFDDEFEKANTENDFNLNIKVGTHSSYTVGLGTSMERPEHEHQHNMALGFRELQTIMQVREPGEDVRIQCKGHIKHQLGHLIGFVHEVEQPEQEYSFCDDVMVGDFMTLLLEQSQESMPPQTRNQIPDIARQRVVTTMKCLNYKAMSNFDTYDPNSIMRMPLTKRWIQSPPNFVEVPLNV